ncbi:YraN family protein [Patescibacteria group bacterium]|nr:YraN family protein [Patescibacteria group bacterium]MBU1703202.1 YraN family protein [Patescibacteria group bacterium]MBU1954371.1 YraN family protein [Patescibacteria group bacterium]
MGSQSKRTGGLGEALALKYLLQKGYGLIKKNHFIRGGEIDLILKKDGILVFVEVKTRRSTAFGAPEGALTPLKKQKLLRAIRTYLMSHPGLAEHAIGPWRCDLIAIEIKGGTAQIKHFTNIFAV